ncbi:MAG: tetratricopeptide repeat protein [Chiayiivirga sp.]|jgi:tetratricopeptide (TPR) repeat protein|uniref:serine/threonine-protein kinase n=1 Tax=Chiayiivirga sp. TaxID=2041042 RepID=UPI0025C0D93C|nr:serine/threonine-protein kinase [Chiayiivirga sp.]MCI1730337.1 tetratricopeptide repeat protein [Chiayiivirga sp.]
MAVNRDDDFAPTQQLATRSGDGSSGGEVLAPGTRLGPYRIEAMLGSGGMGEVYRAEQLEPVHRTVALKRLQGRRLDARQFAYFEVERQLLAQMQHPAIAQIFDAGTTVDGVPYFAMEYIEGRALTAYCEANELGLRARLELFVRVCEGVGHAHQKGVIHRDLKPANILVAEIDGRALPKIIDFGIATAASRAVATAEVAGTPAYMSPEQAGIAPFEVDVRSDVYSLGIVLYELLTGLRPDAANSEPSTERTALRPPSRALETLPGAAGAEWARRQGTSMAQLRQVLRTDLDWVVMRAIRQNRDERYASVGALADDVRRYLDDRPLQAAPGGRLYVARKFIRRHRVALSAGSAIALALVGGLALSLYGLWQADAQRELAERRSRELERVAAFQQSMLKGIDIEAMGKGLVAAQRAQVEAALEKPGADGLSLDGWDALVARTAPADLARAVIDEHVLARALATLDRDFKDEPRLDADLREAIAEVYRGIGGYGRAAQLLEAVSATRATLLGENDEATLRAQSSRAFALNRSGDLAQSRALLESLRQRLAGLPGISEEVRDDIDLNYAVTLTDQGEAAAAIAVQKSLLERVRARDGEQAEQTLTIRNNLAIAQMRAGQREEGRQQFEAVYAARREVLGAEHEDTLVSMMNLAAARGMTRDFDGALALQQEAYAIQRRRLGEDHPMTLAERNNLASTLIALERLDEAHAHLVATYAARRKVLGDQHPQTLRTGLNLAAVLSRLDRPVEALALIHAVADARAASLGPEHPDTLTALANVASSERDAGHPERGLVIARATLAARERVLGAMHPDTIDSRLLVADLLRDSGALDEARGEFQALLSIPDLAQRPRLLAASKLARMLDEAGETGAAQVLRDQWIAPFLARDAGTLTGAERALRDELSRTKRD